MDNEELLKQLDTANLSFNTLIFVVCATVLNMFYINGQRNLIRDKINGASSKENEEDLAKIPVISNKIFTVTASIFLFISYSGLQDIKDSGNEVQIQNQFKRFISAILVLVATLLSSTNLEV